MITQQVINLLDAPVNAIAHQANCFHIMGGGVARAIRERHPAAYEADLRTKKGSEKKLGTFSKAISDGITIYNVYSQYDLSAGIGDRATQYDMVYEGLNKVELDLAESTTHLDTVDTPIVLGLPVRYGCALGGGSWNIVKAIIHDIFDNSPVDVLLCEWPAPVKEPKNEILGSDIFRKIIDRARGGPAPIRQIGYARASMVTT